MCGEDFIPASGGPIGRGPIAVGEIAAIGGVLDHAIQRDVLDDFELSHLNLRVLGCQHPSLDIKRCVSSAQPNVAALQRLGATSSTWELAVADGGKQSAASVS